jgi:hypothetical protein
MMHHLWAILNPDGHPPRRRPSLLALCFAVLAILFAGLLFLLVYEIRMHPRPGEVQAPWFEVMSVAFVLSVYGVMVIWRWISAVRYGPK